MARDILTVRSPLVEHSQRARANTLGLRRFEKDYFINIGAPEKQADYLAKWKDQKERLLERLEVLDKLALSDADRETVRSHAQGRWTRTSRASARSSPRSRTAASRRTQDANTAITPYKDEIRAPRGDRLRVRRNSLEGHGGGRPAADRERAPHAAVDDRGRARRARPDGRGRLRDHAQHHRAARRGRQGGAAGRRGRSPGPLRGRLARRGRPAARGDAGDGRLAQAHGRCRERRSQPAI